MNIVLATSNKGKIRELNALLAPLELQVSPQSDFGIDSAEETGLTFVENALIKARHAAQHTQLPALADDSGLVVPALNGEPGIYSARYAGLGKTQDEHNLKLLAQLKKITPKARQAYFYCVIVFLTNAHDPTPLICTGKWLGEITDNKMGTEGFGYDPIFFIPQLNKTAAELSLEEKSRISHRGQATQQLVKKLREYLCTHSRSKN